MNYTDFPNDFRALTEKRCIFIKQNRTMLKHDTVSNIHNENDLL